ncbi:MAG: VCBS repeat-containing protein [Actinobacteria bacterium]|nr:VCBS repeat-containing protein [Actinomycetota bacterium]
MRVKSVHAAGNRLRPAVSIALGLLLAVSVLVFPELFRAEAANTGGNSVQGNLNVGSSFHDAKITAEDIDGDGFTELLVGNSNGNLYCFDHNAGVKWAYNTGAQIRGAPACKDVDGDGTKEVFVGDMNGVVWGFSCNGALLTQWGWPKATQSSPGGGVNGVYSSPAIGDINGDGADDIVVGTWGKYVYAWSYTGVLLPGWPYDNKDSVWSSPALADIDMDGIKEIIVGADSTGGSGWPWPAGGLLYAFNGDGGIVPGFPRVTPEVLWSSPAVADIDGDGLQEIIIGTGHYYKAIGRLTTEGHRVYAYNHDGTDVPGWPVVAAGSTFSSPAVGDIDGDGTKEIVIACNPMNGIGNDHIMAIKPDGTVMWSNQAFGGPNLGSPALGDVDGDGYPDIVMGSGWAIGAWDRSGRVIWDQPLDNFLIASPAVGDFDNDGHVEVACCTGDIPGGTPGGSFWVFDCGPKKRVSGGDASLFPWGMFRYTSDHNGTILTGNEPPPPPPPPPPANFHEYIPLMNPGGATANAQIRLMNEKGEKATVSLTLAPSSRSTVFINRYMPGCSVSAKVTSDNPIICERAMYFNFQGRWQGGTASAGAQAPAAKWYLAEGYTSDNFDEYVLVQNPQKNSVTVNMTFMRESDTPVSAAFEVSAESRFTLNLKDVPGLQNASASTLVEATGDVICERSMYFNYNGYIGGHNAMGVTEPARQWYLAEGYTAQGYDTFVLIQNPGNEKANVDVNFLRKDGYVGQVSFTLPARSRKTIKVDDVPGFEAAEVSTEVHSDADVIAERAMYFNAGGRTGGHDSTGVSEPAGKWYLAEGYTGGSFDTYVLIMNPGDSAAEVKTTFIRGDGHTWSRTDSLLPNSRFTVHIDEMPGFDNAEVSTLVEGQNGAKVIAERAMYFIYNDLYAGGHDSIGVNNPGTTWYFAEGYTGN